MEFEGADVLLGYTHFTIFTVEGQKIYDYRWEVSNYFWKSENQYMDEEAQIEWFWNIFDHFFDEQNFSRISDMKITGLLRSSDADYCQDIMADSTSIGLSFKVQDYCLSYSKKYQRAVLLRALRKDLLEKYNLHYQ